LLSEDINVMYGQSGSGKSYLAAIWGQAIQHGVSICGLRTIQGNVLLIDYETTAAKIRRRLRRINAGLGLEGNPMLYIPASVPIAHQLEALQRYVMQHDIGFIIVDSLARAVGGKITDEEGVGTMFEGLRQLELPALIIHHTNRADEYYGSPFIRAYARNLWRLRSVQNEGTSRLSIQLQQEKENDGPGIGNLGFVLEFEGDPVDPDSVTLSPQDASLVPDTRGSGNSCSGTLKKRIVTACSLIVLVRFLT
jgi:energy-coupling factor transporter ATP-binding protein EcfA2